MPRPGSCPAPSSAPPTGSQTHSPAQAKPASIDVFLSYSRHDGAAMHVVLESLPRGGVVRMDR